MAVPKPDAFVTQTFREQTQTNGFVEQLKNKLRRRRVRDAQTFPIHAVIRLCLAQMQQQPVAQFADRHGRLLGQIAQHRRRRGVAQQEKSVAHERERRLVIEKFCVGDGMIFAAGQCDAVRERKLLVAVFQMRRERDNLPVKLQRLAIVGEFEVRRVTPAREPLEQFRVRQNQHVRAVVAVAMRIGNPLDEFPVVRRKQFLLVRGANDEINHLAQRARLLARARARQKKLHREPVMRRFVLARLHAADNAERGARRIEQRQRGRSEPVFQFLHELHFLLGFLGLGKTVEARVHRQFRRHGTFRAQK